MYDDINNPDLVLAMCWVKHGSLLSSSQLPDLTVTSCVACMSLSINWNRGYLTMTVFVCLFVCFVFLQMVDGTIVEEKLCNHVIFCTLNNISKTC